MNDEFEHFGCSPVMQLYVIINHDAYGKVRSEY